MLRQAPSVYVYQQGLGDNAPEITVRGLRGLEIATTLDDVPTQDLLAPGQLYLANNLGGVFTLSQISGVSLYPGVAYPDKNTFGTIGGTIAYTSKRGTDDRYFDVTGSIGSFGTYKEGFEFNSGRLDGPLGTGDNAPKVLLNYNNLQSEGFIDGTPNRENEMEFAFDKPYDDAQSNFQATVIYNTATGLIENEPVPIPYLQQNGRFSNYPTNLDFAAQRNDFLTLILKNDTYINDTFKVGITAFYLNNDNQLETYGDPRVFVPGGQTSILSSGNSTPFINNPAGFGEGGLFGPAGGGDPIGIYGNGYGGYFYGTGHTYDPSKYYNNPKACPPSIIAAYGGAGYSPCGLNDEIVVQHTDTYGIQPRVTITPPDIAGIGNTIKIGGLVAKETSPAQFEYLGAFPNTPQTQANAYGENSGGVMRTIYQLYAQDKIEFLENTLHVTPGLTIEGTSSSDKSADIFRSKASPYYGPNGVANGGTETNRFGPYSATKWDRDYLPFFNVSYDLDKVVPALKGTTLYASFGESALFAPVTDFGPNTAGPPPGASIVHLYEGGAQYVSSSLLITGDYFYQKIDRDFGFYSSQSGTNFGASTYSNTGQREIKGVEAKTEYNITPSIQLFGNASYTLAKYLRNSLSFVTVAEDQYGVALKGTHVSGVPDWLSTFGADYHIKSAIRDGDAFDARLTGQYTGHQYTTYDLQGSNVYVAGVPGVDYSGGLHSTNVFDTFTGATTTDPGGGISPFVVFNLDMNYTIPTPDLPAVKKITFDLNIQNLFDQKYFQYFYKQISPASCSKTTTNPTGNPYGCTPQFADGIPGEPFSVFFTVTARF